MRLNRSSQSHFVERLLHLSQLHAVAFLAAILALRDGGGRGLDGSGNVFATHNRHRIQRWIDSAIVT